MTLEFILTFPVIFIATLAIFQFAFLALMLQAGTSAVIEGTRKGAAAYPNGMLLDASGPNNDIADQIMEVMNRHLGVHRIQISDVNHGVPQDPDKAQAKIVIERREGVGAASVVERGELPSGFSCTRTGDGPLPGEIVITLCFPIVDPDDPAGLGNPVPDWLSLFGFSLADYTFQMSSRASLE